MWQLIKFGYKPDFQEEETPDVKLEKINYRRSTSNFTNKEIPFYIPKLPNLQQAFF